MEADSNGSEFARMLALLGILPAGITGMLRRVIHENGPRVRILPDQQRHFALGSKFFLKIGVNTSLLELAQIPGVKANSHEWLGMERYRPS